MIHNLYGENENDEMNGEFVIKLQKHFLSEFSLVLQFELIVTRISCSHDLYKIITTNTVAFC